MLRQFTSRFGGNTSVSAAASCLSATRSLHYIPRIQDIEFTMYDVLGYTEHYEKMAPDLDRYPRHFFSITIDLSTKTRFFACCHAGKLAM